MSAGGRFLTTLTSSWNLKYQLCADFFYNRKGIPFLMLTRGTCTWKVVNNGQNLANVV